jgi:RNA polymerase sigma-70 factor (ECF subfamily)
MLDFHPERGLNRPSIPVVNGNVVQMSECTTSSASRQRTDVPTPPADNLMAVVAHYQGPLLHYVGRMLGSLDDQREDVVQETFIRLHRQISAHGAASIRNLTTWLFQVAHNLAVDVLRQKVKRPEVVESTVDPAVVEEEQAADEMDTLGEAIRREARRVALSELANLDESYRQVVLLKIVQDMPLRQVAEVVGVSISTVNDRLNRGLTILARRLKQAGVV